MWGNRGYFANLHICFEPRAAVFFPATWLTAPYQGTYHLNVKDFQKNPIFGWLMETSLRARDGEKEREKTNIQGEEIDEAKVPRWFRDDFNLIVCVVMNLHWTDQQK